MQKLFVKKSIIIVLVALVLFYIGCQAFYIRNKKVTTETAIYTTVNDSIDSVAFIIRDETIIYNDKDGIVNYTIDDGAKVSNGGEIAALYKSVSDVTAQKEIEKIGAEIQKLKSIEKMSGAVSTNPNTVDKQIYDALRELINDVNDAKYQQLVDDRSNVLYLINQRNSLVGKGNEISGRLAELNSKREQLALSSAQRLGTINSPKAGYFSSKIDGYEGRFNFQDVQALLPSNLKSEYKAEKEQPQNVLGKVIGSFGWYIACIVDNDELLKIKEGDRINVTFPFSSMDDVPCIVASVNTEAKSKESAVILKCNSMNGDLIYLRNESVRINVASYSGILISKKSLHEDVLTREVEDEYGNVKLESKKVQGVYTLYGSEAVFKQVIPIYANNSSIVCKENPEEGELFSGETIRVYDEVISEGTGLYNGKIVK